MRFPLCLPVIAVSLILSPLSASAHDWHQHPGERHHLPEVPNTKSFQETSQQETHLLTGYIRKPAVNGEPDIAQHFAGFTGVKVRWSADKLFVESDGLPDHNMMIGIRSWQQQVPLPQPFTGSNAWQIPLRPSLADKPISARTNLFRGAIALAVNGVPIFNALNNRGEDTFLAGELDQWGGHCGRGDDYHYHIAPVHLEDTVGKGRPIAYALDGFPIYGLTEADGSAVGELDEFNGQFDEERNYHYHATETYPYINGGMRGVVEVQGGQIEPQPRDSPIRSPLQPLRGAVITNFQRTENQSVLTYKLENQTGSVSYAPVGESAFRFTYREPNGKTWSETYRRQAADGRRAMNFPAGPVMLIVVGTALSCLFVHCYRRRRKPVAVRET